MYALSRNFFLFISKMLFYGYAESQLLFFCAAPRWSEADYSAKLLKIMKILKSGRLFFALFLSICWLDMIMKWEISTYSPRYSIIYLLFLTLFL